MKFVFENGKEVICNDEYIARILRQDKRYKEATNGKSKATDKEVAKNKKTPKTKTTDKEVAKAGDKNAEVQE